MEDNTKQDRWEDLFNMIVALAKGNFSYQIKRSGSEDELEALVALCNMLAEELRETFNHHSYLDPRRSYRYIAIMTFVLDAELRIINFNREVPILLYCEEEALVGKLFEELLEADSILEWEKLSFKAANPGFNRYSMKLNFRTTRELSLPAFCFISKLTGLDQIRYSVTSFQAVLLEEFEFNEDPEVYALKEDPGAENSAVPIFEKKLDFRIVHDVRDFILENLSATIPNIKDLAHRFGTNESKLKKDFREAFKSTPYQFYSRERMNLAKELILNSTLPLNSIAETTGFKTYPHFSYAFKKEFGYSPFQLRNPPKK